MEKDSAKPPIGLSVLIEPMDFQSIVFQLSMQKQLYLFFLDKKVPSLFYFFITDGALGVNIFFVISGFLITSLLIKEENSTGKISLKNFYIRRSLRIFPAYFFLLLVYYILESFKLFKISNISWLTALTYTKYFDNGAEWLTRHSWSLSVEEHFYLFWPFVFIYFPKHRKLISILIVLVVPIFRLFFYWYPSSFLMPDLNFFVRIDAIAVGCILSLYQKKMQQFIYDKGKISFYLSLIFLLLLYPLEKWAAKMNFGIFFIIFGGRSGTMGNILIGLVLMYSIFGNHGVWFKILNSMILNYLGTLSYSIYLWQQIFTSPLKFWFTSFPQNIFLTFICAIGSFYLIEKPFLRLKTNYEIKLIN